VSDGGGKATADFPVWSMSNQALDDKRAGTRPSLRAQHADDTNLGDYGHSVLEDAYFCGCFSDEWRAGPREGCDARGESFGS
jgi:hypothetical protein